MLNRSEKAKSSNVTKETSTITATHPHLVRYLEDNVPFRSLPVNTLYIFTEDACTLLNAMVPKGLFNVPVIMYKLSDTNFNFFNYKLELIGGICFAKDFSLMTLYGKEFEDKTGFATYKLMSLAFDYAATDELIKKKFENIKIFVPNKQK